MGAAKALPRNMNRSAHSNLNVRLDISLIHHPHPSIAKETAEGDSLAEEARFEPSVPQGSEASTRGLIIHHTFYECAAL